MKLILQILFVFLTWFTNLANATPVFTKVALPSYELTFSKTDNSKDESIVKITAQNFARSGISENSFSQKSSLRVDYALFVASRAGECKAVSGAGNWATAIGKNIDEFVDAPLGYQIFTKNGSKYIRRIDATNINTPLWCSFATSAYLQV